LRFSTAFKNKVLSCLFFDPRFFANVSPYLDEDFFDLPPQIEVFRIICHHYEKFGSPPTREYLLEEASALITRTNQPKEVWIEILRDVLTEPVEKEYIEDRIGEYIKKVSLAKASQFVIENLEIASLGDLQDVLSRALNICTPNGYEGTRILANARERVKKFAEEPELKLPTKIPQFDRLIGGGLSPGEVGVIFALSGVGKSVSLVNIGFGSVIQGMKVVYYSLEMSERRIAARFDSLFSGVAHETVYKDPEKVAEVLEKLYETFGDSLIVKHFPAGTVGVSSLKLHLDHLKRTGFDAEVVIVDYLTLLRSRVRFHNTYEEAGSICRDLKGLASERNLIIWTASQANRKAVGAELVDARHIADSFRIFADADVVISLTQTPLEQKQGRLRAYATKVRDRRRGGVEVIKTDYEHMRLCQELAEVVRKIRDFKRFKRELTGRAI